MACTLVSLSAQILPQYKTIKLSEGDKVTLGRNQFNLGKEEAKRLSRNQVTLEFNEGRLTVTQVGSTALVSTHVQLGVNPGGVIQKGKFCSLEQKQQATLKNGDTFCLIIQNLQFQVNLPSQEEEPPQQQPTPPNPLKRKAESSKPDLPVCPYDGRCYR
jgi:hypothetical protein